MRQHVTTAESAGPWLTHGLPRCREWGIRVCDWQTQCSMSVSSDTSSPELTYRLRRLLPVAGCEEDSISFEEEHFTGVSPDWQKAHSEAQAWPGGYVLSLPQSTRPQGSPGLRVEHCIMTAAEERIRIVQHASQGELPSWIAVQPWSGLGVRLLSCMACMPRNGNDSKILSFIYHRFEVMAYDPPKNGHSLVRQRNTCNVRFMQCILGAGSRLPRPGSTSLRRRRLCSGRVCTTPVLL